MPPVWMVVVVVIVAVVVLTDSALERVEVVVAVVVVMVVVSVSAGAAHWVQHRIIAATHTIAPMAYKFFFKMRHSLGVRLFALYRVCF